MSFSDLLDLRSSFLLAAAIVTWVAIILLALIAANLHSRLVRLEAANNTSAKNEAYSHLLGRRLPELAAFRPEVVLFLSAHCPTCEQVLDQLLTSDWERRMVIAWKDQTRRDLVLPPSVVEWPDGMQLSANLGINVTPFGLELDQDTRVVSAGPVAHLSSLAREGAAAGVGG